MLFTRNQVVQASLCLSVVMVCQQQGYAAETNVSTTMTTDSSVMKTLSEKAILSLSSYYRGGPLSDIGNGYQPDATGVLDSTAPQSMENLVTLGYRLNKDISVVGITHFYYYPDLAKNALGQSFQMYDPVLGVTHSNLYTSGGLNITGKLLAYLPVTQYDTEDKQGDLTTLSAVASINYDVPDTKLSIGLYNQFYVYVPSAHQIAQARTYKIYSAPYAQYTFSQRVAATLWVDLIQITRNQGTGFLTGMDNPAMDIEPGFKISFTDKISLNPMINFYPGTPTLAATSVQALLTAKAF